MHSNYFQGILQLRNPNKEVTNFIAKQDNIMKQVKVRNGIDFYFTSNKILKSLGYKLQKMFSGELKFSAKLHTRSRQTSKELYRLNVLFRIPKFKKGDTVQYKGEPIKIISLGKKVFAKKENGKKVTLRYGDLD